MTSATPIQWLGPLPPLRTGIAAYCNDLLRAVDGLWTVELFPEAGSGPVGFRTVSVSKRKKIDLRLPTIIQVGNSENHERAFQAAQSGNAILVLHDVVLHHALLARHVRQGTDREYWRELALRYGDEGVRVGRAILAGRSVEDLQAFPLSESFIEAARLVVVHSEYAENQVRRHVPTARVVRIPMGVPLPGVIPQHEARKMLGIGQSEFVVTSITHVNPNKRLPTVLRAMRRLASRLPEARLIVAGSGSDGADLQREVRLLGLEQIVTCWGYVDDSTTRMLAAAGDVCVNLRYPSTGETSASLLRLLAAGKPVIVTDDGSSRELPGRFAFKVAPDRLEVDIIEELLLELAMNERLRLGAGDEARDWVRNMHSMGAAVDGYRDAIASTYGVDLPGLTNPVISEAIPMTSKRHRQPADTVEPSIAVAIVGDAISELGILPESSIIRDAARSIVELRLVRSGTTSVRRPGTISRRLRERLACPQCWGEFSIDEDELVCATCGQTFTSREGVPNFSKSGDLY